MDGLSDFIVRQNIERFFNHLEIDRNPDSRATVRRLLISEEDKFADNTEQLDMLDYNLNRASARIQEQKTLIARLSSDGEDTSLATEMLANLEDLRALFVRHRQTVVARIAIGPL